MEDKEKAWETDMGRNKVKLKCEKWDSKIKRRIKQLHLKNKSRERLGVKTKI